MSMSSSTESGSRAEAAPGEIDDDALQRHLARLTTVELYYLSARLSLDYVPQRLLLLGSAQSPVEVALPPRSWGQDGDQAAQFFFQAGQTMPAATPARLLAVFTSTLGWLEDVASGAGEQIVIAGLAADDRRVFATIALSRGPQGRLLAGKIHSHGVADAGGIELPQWNVARARFDGWRQAHSRSGAATPQIAAAQRGAGQIGRMVQWLARFSVGRARPTADGASS
jgi:hypothetical protein